MTPLKKKMTVKYCGNVLYWIPRVNTTLFPSDITSHRNPTHIWLDKYIKFLFGLFIFFTTAQLHEHLRISHRKRDGCLKNNF